MTKKQIRKLRQEVAQWVGDTGTNEAAQRLIRQAEMWGDKWGAKLAEMKAHQAQMEHPRVMTGAPRSVITRQGQQWVVAAEDYLWSSRTLKLTLIPLADALKENPHTAII